MNKKIMFEPATIVLFGGFILLICTFLAQRTQDSDSKKDKQELLEENKIIRNELKDRDKELLIRSEEASKIQRERDEKITDLQKKLLETSEFQVDEQKLLRVKSEEIAELYKNLSKKNEEIVVLTKELNNNLTGANSIPCVIFDVDQKNDVSIIIYNDGKYPLHDLEISILGVNNILRNTVKKDSYGRDYRDIGNDLFDNPTFEMNSNSLSPYGIKTLQKIHILEQGNSWFCVHIKSRNGEWFQKICVTKYPVSMVKIAVSQLYTLDRSVFPFKASIIKVVSKFDLDKSFKEINSKLPKSPIPVVDWNDCNIHWDGNGFYAFGNYYSQPKH